MLLLDRKLVERARNARSTADVIALLDGAVTLELSTLPPYLTGVFSLKPGSNDAIRALVMSVVLQEMLHMAIAANTSIAIGGNPAVFKAGLALRYPGPLPMSVEESLVVSLQPLTIEQTKDVFMMIERPDTTATLPGEPPAHAQRVMALKKQGYASIGEFYQAIIDALTRLAATGDPFADPRLDRQLDLARWFPAGVPGNPSCKVRDLPTAIAGLETIVRQGEGAQIGDDPIAPYAGGDSLAHYFKFGEVAFGHTLTKDAAQPSGWAYAGDAVLYDAGAVYDFPANAKVSDYPAGSAARITAETFYESYVRLLRVLDATFNGEPHAFDAALGVMFELKLIAQQVVQHPADPKQASGKVAAPPFQP
ncbi:MAG TPA: ferritin-like protein [Kofleriaceae bacterium]|nr:ferritin-like protein [Kofleriaceae bacterium]